MKDITCKKCRKQFSPYIDSTLDDEENNRVKAHLEKCEKCAEEWQLFNKTVSIIHNLPKEKAPPSLIPDLHQKLEKQSRKGFSIRDKIDLIRDWFSALPLKRTYFGFISFIFLGFLTTTLIYYSPFQDSGRFQLAGKDKEKNQENTNSPQNDKGDLTVLSQNEEIAPKEYYPDIPPLSEYEPGNSLPYPDKYKIPDLLGNKSASKVVDLVNTGRYNRKKRIGSFFPTIIPDIIDNNKEPDLRIIFFPQNDKEKKLQTYKLIHSSAWKIKEQINENTLLLLVPSENLDEFASLCSHYKGYTFQNLWNNRPQAEYYLVSVNWH